MYYKHDRKKEKDQEMGRGEKEGRERGCKKELTSIMYMWQLSTRNRNITYCIHVLIN